eukprot:Sspe_Gene.39058::Locus_18854_Transcript_1_1_Confidence_1.000_Length_1419::g.39058::m.39058
MPSQDDALTIEYLTSKPLFPDFSPTDHLQRILAVLIQSVKTMEAQMGNFGKTLGQLEDKQDSTAQIVSALQLKTSGLEKQLGDLRNSQDDSVKPLKWELQDTRALLDRANEHIADLDKKLDETRHIADTGKRSLDDVSSTLSRQVDSLQKDADARDRKTKEAMVVLEGRLDNKADMDALHHTMAAVEDAAKRQGTEVDTLRRICNGLDETVKKHNTEMEQLRLSHQGRERLLSEQVAGIERTLDNAVKRSQAAAESAVRQELDQVAIEMAAQNRRVEENVAVLADKVDRHVEESVRQIQRQVDDLSRRMLDGQKNNDLDKAKIMEAIKRLQIDLTAVGDAVERSDHECKTQVNRLRDDTDQKLLELLNAIQGIEQSKAGLERQIAEAGRIMMSVQCHMESPPELKMPKLLRDTKAHSYGSYSQQSDLSLNRTSQGHSAVGNGGHSSVRRSHE